jgi:hypothetical protein
MRVNADEKPTEYKEHPSLPGVKLSPKDYATVEYCLDKETNEQPKPATHFDLYVKDKERWLLARLFSPIQKSCHYTKFRGNINNSERRMRLHP